MKGGVVTKITDEPIVQQVNRIIASSNLSPLSNGSYGFTIYVHAEGFDTGFMNYETGKVARHFILKIVPIDVFMTYKANSLPIEPEKYTRKTTFEKFMEEPELLHHGYEASLKYHHIAMCPAMLLSAVYTIEQLEAIMPDVYAYASGVPDRIIPREEYKDYSVGIIFMECAAGRTISDYLKKHPARLNEIKQKAIRLYCIAIDCGIEHDDPNKANIMIDSRGNLTLIDFGYAKKLTEPKRDLYNKLIAKSIASKDYRELIQLLSARKWKDGKMFGSYKWFYENTQESP
jgi:serine/threonine protein kinase